MKTLALTLLLAAACALQVQAQKTTFHFYFDEPVVVYDFGNPNPDGSMDVVFANSGQVKDVLRNDEGPMHYIVRPMNGDTYYNLILMHSDKRHVHHCWSRRDTVLGDGSEHMPDYDENTEIKSRIR